MDLTVSLVTYFVTKYVNPDAAKDVLFILAGAQPVILLVIGSITAQNIAAIKAGAPQDNAAKAQPK